jgi:hypothetical protein
MKSVAESTQQQYARAWTRWKMFISALATAPVPPDAPDSTFAPHDLPKHTVVRLLAMWTHFLIDDLVLSAESISQHLSALNYHFRRLYCDSAAFQDPQLLACKRAIFLDPRGFRGTSRQTLPATLEMVQDIIDHFNRPSPHKRIVAVATALAFCCLLRPSEYLDTRTRKNSTAHILRAKQILFERASTKTGSPTFYPAHALPASFRFDECRSVKIVFFSAKNIDIRSARTVWFSADTTAALPLPRILFEWARTNHLHADDYFLSYRAAPSSRTVNLNYHRMNSILKFTAGKQQLPGTRYSCHCLRVGGASLLRAAGADDSEIMALGRWRSLPACIGYQAPSTATNDRLLTFLGRSGVFTNRDVHLSTVPSRTRATPIPAQRKAPKL